MSSPNRRIFLNIIATYGRSVFALVCGLLTGRWLLMVLGHSDYGLYGVVGGLTAFISFFNSMLSGSIGRYYAVAVGRASKSTDGSGLELCREWFNTALFVHTVAPSVLMLTGYPLGAWAIEHWLTIPADRVADCVWVFRFVCLSCFIGMVNVPFNAMYVAKQYIAELTIYSVSTTAINFVVMYYMVMHPGYWLVKYAAYMCALSIVPQIIISVRAVMVFPECRVRKDYLVSWERMRSLGVFVGWQTFSTLGYLLRVQGTAILVNKMFGPIMNAAMAVANNLAGQTNSLSGALNGAFSPAIMNLEGAGEREKMLKMSYRSCKFGVILCLIFAIPLSLESEAVLTLWLKDPPPLAWAACLITLATILMDQATRGVNISVEAHGKIGLYSFVYGVLSILGLPFAWLLVHFSIGGFLSVFVAIFVFRAASSIAGAIISEHLIGFSFAYWIKSVIFKGILVISLSLTGGLAVKLLFMDKFWVRLLFVFSLSEALFLFFAWILLLDVEEKKFVCSKICWLWGKVRRPNEQLD